ncbi:3-isopropylmalate dehydratase large subunit [Dirofilaria immitis]
MIIKKLVLPGLILAYIYAKEYSKKSEKDTVKQWWRDTQWNPLIDKIESKRWWRGNFRPWDGNFEPWNESNGGEDFIVFPGGRFGAWGDRIFIKRKK